MFTGEEEKGASSARRAIRNGGFTMIETIAVLLLIGIIAAVVVSRMGDTRAYDLVSQVDVVKGHLRYAQSRAMNSSDYYGINFNSSTIYYLFQGVGSTTPILLPGEDNATVSLTAKNSGLTITPPAGGRITFDGYGSPCAASGTPPASLTADVTITTNGGNITVTKNTGFIP